MKASAVCALLLAFSLTCSSRPEKTRHLARGSWGGDHVLLEVTDNGASLEFDCAAGQITQAVVLDGEGRFDLAGTYSPEHGGPVRKGENPAASARYRGRVDGDSMTLTIIKGKHDIGTYELTRERQPILTKCR